ncbi:MAG: hypothetical protein ACLQIQ_08620 [Beijerinckiaceae bacterium]
MDIRFEMQAAEDEIHKALSLPAGEAINAIIHAYERRTSDERDTLVAVVATRIVGGDILRRSTITPSLLEES